LNLFSKDIRIGGKVEKIMWYVWIEEYGDISKIKREREKENLNNIILLLISFHYSYLRVQSHNYMVRENIKIKSSYYCYCMPIQWLNENSLNFVAES